MKRPVLFIAILIVQVLSASFFLLEILSALTGFTLGPISWQFHELIEISAALGLILGATVSAYLVRTSQRRAKHIESQLRAASGAFGDLMEEKFASWRLTPAERDVALFAIKGYSTQDIAELRATSEGTVKAQTNAIYRKAGVSGRSQLLCLFIDDLIEGPLS